MNNNVAVKVENVTKVYRLYDKPQDRLKEALNPFKKSYHHDFYALHDVSFEMKKGETVGIIGRNGAGKSTLLKIITGVLTPTNGNVEVNGKIASLLELGAGFNPEMTGLENIYLNGTLMGFTHEEMESKVDTILKFADIGEFIHQTAKTYSSGMFARLAFSVAINVEPDILIVDEILSVGDQQFQKKCVDRIDVLRSKGISILLVAHDEYTIRNLCQRALYLKEGKQVCFTSSSEAITKYQFDMEDKLSLTAKNNSSTVHTNPQEKFYFEITTVKLFDNNHTESTVINSGSDVSIEFEYKCKGNYTSLVSFVVNLYREDGLYIFGTTTLMRNIEPFIPLSTGKVSIKFPKLMLLQGYYKWRVAVNDDTGMNIFCEAVNVCEFKIIDSFKAVGTIDLKHQWEIH